MDLIWISLLLLVKTIRSEFTESLRILLRNNVLIGHVNLTIIRPFLTTPSDVRSIDEDMIFPILELTPNLKEFYASIARGRWSFIGENIKGIPDVPSGFTA
ncbi:hypothetical protein ACOME3_006108 [Neoechinorhynchus agilis]